MEWTGITIFYAVCLLAGFLVALLGAIFGEIAGNAEIQAGHAEFGDHAIEHETEIGHSSFFAGDLGDQMPGASVFNTITLATFIGFLGLAGLIGAWGLDFGPGASVAFAFPIALLIAGMQFWGYVKILVKSQSSSEARVAELIGREADVVTSIPSGAVGEVAYVIRGSRYAAPAVSTDGVDIELGRRVVITEISGNNVVVRIKD